MSIDLTFSQALEVQDAKKEVRKYIKRLRTLSERERLPELKYLYVIGGGTYSKKTKKLTRIHAHIITNITEKYRRVCESLWSLGHSNAAVLDADDNGLMGKSSYISHHIGTRADLDSETPSLRRWEHSRNLTPPIVRQSDKKISRKRVTEMVLDAESVRDVLEKLYPEYRIIGIPSVYLSDWVQGAYIYATLYRKASRDSAAVTRPRGELRGNKNSHAGACADRRRKGG